MTLRTWLTCALGDPRGSILLSGLMIVFVTVLLGLAFFDLAAVENRLILGDDCTARALYAAEAGLQVAYRDLANGTAIGSVDFDGVIGNATYASRANLTGYSPPRTLSGGGALPTTYTVQACKWDTTLAACASSGTTIMLWSTGAATQCPGSPGGSGSATVRADVTKTTLTLPGGGQGHSFVGLDEITTGGAGFLLDSFDSSKGPYDCLGGTAGCTVPTGTRNKCQQTTAPFTCNIGLWTNGPDRTTLDGGPIYGNLTSASGEVKLKTAPTIYGSITYDPGDGTFTGNAAQVKGGVTAQANDPITLPPVPWPGTDVSGGPGQDCRTHPNLVPGTLTPRFSSAAYVASRITSGTYSYTESTGVFLATSNITMNPGASPAMFCFSDFEMKGKGLTIPAGVTNPVEIYIGSDTGGGTIGQALLDGNVVNSTGQSQYLRVFSISNKGNDDVWVTSGDGSFVFAYAPYGQVQVKGGGKFFGSAFGNQLEASGGSQLHFDNALLSVPGLPGLTAGVGGGSSTISYGIGEWKQCRNSACS